MMTFSEAAKILNIPSFPEEMDVIWENVEKSCEKPISRELIQYLQEEYDLFQGYYEAVLEGFDDLERDEARRVWSYTVAAFAKTHKGDELRALKVPETDGTPAGHMAPLFPLIARAEEGYLEYLRRGFPEEEARGYLGTYRRSMGVTKSRTGKPGIQKTYFNWSGLYAYAEIFNVGGFNFQIARVAKTTYVIMNKSTREIRVLLHDVVLHASGMPLGCAGITEEEGSYTVSFVETEKEYIGYPAVDFLCPNIKQYFPKAEWKLILQPNDCVFGLHIPKGTDLAPDQVSEAIRLARAVARRSFPEHNIKAVRCTSWLLSPKLNELLGDGSKISNFSNLFSRYPVKSDAQSVFSFAFGGKPQDLRDLPEGTSLQRKVKALYLSGGYVHNYGGFILDEETITE